MMNGEVVLSGGQRDEIMKAVKAIQDRMKEMNATWQDRYVIGTNLTIIQTNLSKVTRASSN
jgi:hypothetical protein